METEEIEFSDKQLKVLDYLMRESGNVLLTGDAGTGKSLIIRTYIDEHRKKTGREPVILAPTGLAAINVGGATIHSFFGFSPSMQDPNHVYVSEAVHKRLKATTVIVLDEISMIRSDIFQAMDSVLREVKRKPRTPFGGVRMILVGDFYQLPPIVKAEERNYLRHLFDDDSGWIFTSDAYRELKPKFFYLDQSFRHKDDPGYAAMLNRLRDGDTDVVEDFNKAVLNEAEEDVPSNAILLATTNAIADSANAEFLASIDSPREYFHARISGEVKQKQYPLPETIELKVGARIMCAANRHGYYVNGSLGTILGFHQAYLDGDRVTVLTEKEIERDKELGFNSSTRVVEVELDDGYTEYVVPATWEVYGYEVINGRLSKTVLGTFTQMPLKLAWSITIHKSQGMTLERIIMNLGSGAFAHGQLYVALSRVRTFDGLCILTPIKPRDAIVDRTVLRFLKSGRKNPISQ